MSQLLPWFRSTRLAGGLSLALIGFGLPALADLTAVAPGDVLRVEVSNAPEFSRQASVDTDGRIALPMLGQIAVAGLDLDAARQAIAEALLDKGLLNAPQVLVEIAQYRPVYVGGSVRNPGAVDFVPGLTARQAVIAAGGVEYDKDAKDQSPEAALSAIAARRSTAFRLAQISARIMRLEAEIDGADQLKDAKDAPLEAAMLQERRQRASAREDHTKAVLGLIANEIDTLDRQAKLQDGEAALQKAEIENAKSLVDRKLMPRTQYQDLLREQSQLSRNQLETQAFAARAAQEATTVRFELAKTQSQERETLRSDLVEAQARREDLMAQMETLELQILAAGLTTQDPTLALPRTRLTIHRRNGGEVQEVQAALEDPIFPGDVLDLVLVPPMRPQIGAPDLSEMLGQ